MLFDEITMPALTHYADQLPPDVLPHLGSLAHLGLFLSGKSRRQFFRGLAAIFSYMPADHKSGMERVLDVPELDYQMKGDALREANRMRRKVDAVEWEYVRKFFRALRGARALREYYHLLDQFETDGEEAVHSILDGSAFRSGGLVSMLLGEKVAAAQQLAEVNGQGKQLPTYDKDARELRAGNKVMRRYDGKQNKHEIILKAFQRAKWTKRIKIPSCFSNDPRLLRETLDQLNTPQKSRPMLIRFGQQGNKLYWEWRTIISQDQAESLAL
jgi:hypothetical protein